MWQCTKPVLIGFPSDAGPMWKAKVATKFLSIKVRYWFGSRGQSSTLNRDLTLGAKPGHLLHFMYDLRNERSTERFRPYQHTDTPPSCHLVGERYPRRRSQRDMRNSKKWPKSSMTYIRAISLVYPAACSVTRLALRIHDDLEQPSDPPAESADTNLPEGHTDDQPPHRPTWFAVADLARRSPPMPYLNRHLST